jgi:fatty-acid desaturase
VGRFEFDPGWVAIKVFKMLGLIGVTGPIAKLTQ